MTGGAAGRRQLQGRQQHQEEAGCLHLCPCRPPGATLESEIIAAKTQLGDNVRRLLVLQAFSRRRGAACTSCAAGSGWVHACSVMAANSLQMHLNKL